MRKAAILLTLAIIIACLALLVSKSHAEEGNHEVPFYGRWELVVDEKWDTESRENIRMAELVLYENNYFRMSVTDGKTLDNAVIGKWKFSDGIFSLSFPQRKHERIDAAFADGKMLLSNWPLTLTRAAAGGDRLIIPQFDYFLNKTLIFKKIGPSGEHAGIIESSSVFE